MDRPGEGPGEGNTRAMIDGDERSDAGGDSAISEAGTQGGAENDSIEERRTRSKRLIGPQEREIIRKLMSEVSEAVPYSN